MIFPKLSTMQFTITAIARAAEEDRLWAKSTVTEGALVRLSGRYFIIAVSTAKFTCQGQEIMGISTMAPIFEEIEGARAGETVDFKGRSFLIERSRSGAHAIRRTRGRHGRRL